MINKSNGSEHNWLSKSKVVSLLGETYNDVERLAFNPQPRTSAVTNKKKKKNKRHYNNLFILLIILNDLDLTNSKNKKFNYLRK